MSCFAFERKVQLVTIVVVVFHIDRRNDYDDILAISIDMQMYGRTHHFGNVYNCLDTLVRYICVFRTNTECDFLCLNIVL